MLLPITRHKRKAETAEQDGKTTHKVYDYNNLDQLKNITTTGAQAIGSSTTAYTYDDNGSVSQKIVTEKVVTQNIAGASPDTTSTSPQTTTQVTTTDYQFDIRQQLKTVNTQGQLSASSSIAPSSTLTLSANYFTMPVASA